MSYIVIYYFSLYILFLSYLNCMLIVCDNLSTDNLRVRRKYKSIKKI